MKEGWKEREREGEREQGGGKERRRRERLGLMWAFKISKSMPSDIPSTTIRPYGLIFPKLFN